MTDNEMLRLMKEIEVLMLAKKLYTNPELSLQMLSEELNEKERNISQTINALQGRNVNDFINYHRIEYAKELLAKHPEKAIFEIMYDSGFNTKGASTWHLKSLPGKHLQNTEKR
jgi:YesN/AraC family two-component response regulator